MPQPTHTDKPALCCSTSVPANLCFPVVTSTSCVSFAGLDQIYTSINRKRKRDLCVLCTTEVNARELLNHLKQQLANLVFERDGRFSVEKLTLWHTRMVLVTVILEVRILPLMSRICFKSLNPPPPFYPRCRRLVCVCLPDLLIISLYE